MIAGDELARFPVKLAYLRCSLLNKAETVIIGHWGKKMKVFNTMTGKKEDFRPRGHGLHNF
jgi:hypothetical protein